MTTAKQPHNTSPVIVWFRQDLRLQDNPALLHAAKTQSPIIFLYILDDNKHRWQLGAASRWWLHESLQSLTSELKKHYKANLVLKKGEPKTILSSIVKQTKAHSVFWNDCYEPNAIKRDKAIIASLNKNGITTKTFNSNLLHDPASFFNQSKKPYQIFTAFWRTLQKAPIRTPYSKPRLVTLYKPITSLPLSKLGLQPKNKWFKKLSQHWNPGETAAKNALQRFCRNKLKGYKKLRDVPSLTHTSKLSPHLHFGEISPVQVWHAVQHVQDKTCGIGNDVQCFLSELAWREFSTYLMVHFPMLPDKPLKPAYGKIQWAKNSQGQKAWQQGKTGYPIVDAGMRQLWETGWMHNRVRMIVASFLTKHLLLPWQQGEAWFWETLVDADLGNNAASWQWVAGCGTDAAPYFRIFNPILQSKKFDPDGDYIKHWCPELKKLPSKYLHAPWEAPDDLLKKAKCTLGKTYPEPILDHSSARQRTLSAYKKALSKRS